MILCYPAISNSFLLVCRAGACPSSEFSLCSISWHWSLLLATELLIHSYLSEGLKNMVSKSSHNMNSEGLGEASWCFEMLCRARPDQGSPEHQGMAMVSNLWVTYYLVFSSYKLSLKRAWNHSGYCQGKTVSAVTSHDFPTCYPFITGVAERDSGKQDLANCLPGFTSLKQTGGRWTLNNLFLVSKEQT